MIGFKRYLTEQRGFSPRTVSGYVTAAEKFLLWLQKENIKPQHIRHQDSMAYLRYIDNGARSNHYVQQLMLAARHYYDYLLMTGKVRGNPIVGIIKRGSRKKVLRDALTEKQLNTIYEKYPINTTMGLRNKVVLGLLIYQGIHTYELQRLTVNDIDFNSATVCVPQCNRSNPRTLKLEPVQISALKEYIKKFRPTILVFARIKTDRLIFSIGGSESNGNLLSKMKKAIRKIEPGFTTMAQIRASVIANWTRKYDPIRVMNMAGHRYVSSTEYYMVGDNETLRDELDKVHPLENKEQ